MTSHALYALVRKRAEIAGQIEHLQDALRQAIIDLDNLDHTIRLFDPDIDLAEIKPKPLPPRNQAYQGELTRIILSALRQADRPLTTHELAQHVMAEKVKGFVLIVGRTIWLKLPMLQSKNRALSSPLFWLRIALL